MHVRVHESVYSPLLLASLDICSGAEVVRQSGIVFLHSDGTGVCSDVRRSASFGLHLAECVEQ